jgi:hypothetical protein
MHSMQQSIARMAAADDGSWDTWGGWRRYTKKAKAKQRRGPCARAASKFGVRLAGARICFESCHSSIGALCNLPRRVSATEDLITFGHSPLAGGCRGCRGCHKLHFDHRRVVHHGISWYPIIVLPKDDTAPTLLIISRSRFELEPVSKHSNFGLGPLSTWKFASQRYHWGNQLQFVPF